MNILKKLHAYTYALGFSGLLFFALSFSPASALAANFHNFTCSDFTTHCSSGVITLLTNQNSHSATSLPWISASNTYYLSADITVSGTVSNMKFSLQGVGDAVSTSLYSTSQTLTDVALATPSDFGSFSGVQWTVLPVTGGPGNWTISSICITDTIGGCAGVTNYTLGYTANANGTISGTSPQTVASGGNGTAVTAVPNAGYHFVSWSDSSTMNPRTDTSISGNITVSATFATTTAPNPIGDYLTAAEAGFASTTGFNIESLITWSATNLLELFIGSGLGLLLSLRYWIVALLIIAGVIYFSYRAFRFSQN